jgi:hypothetical protein
MRTRILVCLSVLVPAAFACGESSDDRAPDGTDDEVRAGGAAYLDQGLSATKRETLHVTGQGSRLVPFAWLEALEQANSAVAFMDRKNMRAFGFLYDPPTAANHGLPLGITRETDATGTWAGMTCAACHTGEVRYKGTSFRVDGAQGRVELGAFLVAVSASLKATLDDAPKFDRFAQRVLTAAAADETAKHRLRNEVETFYATFSAMAREVAGPRRAGPGRVDTLNAAYNAITCRAIDVPENCQTAAMATTAPHLWLTSDTDWVQTNGFRIYERSRSSFTSSSRRSGRRRSWARSTRRRRNAERRSTPPIARTATPSRLTR